MIGKLVVFDASVASLAPPKPYKGSTKVVGLVVDEINQHIFGEQYRKIYVLYTPSHYKERYMGFCEPWERSKYVNVFADDCEEV